MPLSLVLFLAFLALLPVVILLEGKRQEKRYGKPSGRGGMTRVGLLELQRHLQPDRKVEVLLEETRSSEEAREGEGDPPALEPLESEKPPTGAAGQNSKGSAPRRPSGHRDGMRRG